MLYWAILLDKALTCNELTVSRVSVLAYLSSSFRCEKAHFMKFWKIQLSYLLILNNWNCCLTDHWLTLLVSVLCFERTSVCFGLLSRNDPAVIHALNSRSRCLSRSWLESCCVLAHFSLSPFTVARNITAVGH